jgi:hypothetical protein
MPHDLSNILARPDHGAREVAIFLPPEFTLLSPAELDRMADDIAAVRREYAGYSVRFRVE